MEWLYIIISIVVVIAVAFLFGWADKNERRGVQCLILIAGLIGMVILEGKGGTVMLLALLALSWIDHLPAWVFYVAGIGVFGFVCWYLFNLLGSGIVELAQEIAATRARIALMENSLRDKLDEIASRLPGTDSPEID